MPTKDYIHDLELIYHQVKSNELFQLIQAGKKIEFIKEFEKQKIPINEKDLELVARTYYDVAKSVQINSRSGVPSAHSLFLKAKEITREPRLKEVIAARLRSNKNRRGLTECNPTINDIINRCNLETPGVLPIEVLRKHRPDIFEQAKSKLSIPGISNLFAIGLYRWRGDSNASQILSQFIREFKIGEELFVAFISFLVKQFVYLRYQDICDVDVVIPIPSESCRAVERDHDLTAELARAISISIGIPIEEPLQRVSEGKKSRFCSYKELASQFSLKRIKGDYFNQMKILLVDDVVTRGFTMQTCSNLLFKVGASSIDGFCVARAESTIRSMQAKVYDNET